MYVEQTIGRLQEEFDNKTTGDTLSSHLEEQLNDSRLELEKIIEVRTKGAILRSKTRWYNEGEKNTKYFLNLEKRHFKPGTISQIKINDREFVTSDEKILTECVSFYKNLYSARSMTYDQNYTTTTTSFITKIKRKKLTLQYNMLIQKKVMFTQDN